MSYEVLTVNPNPLLNLIYTGGFQCNQVNRVQTLGMVAEGKGVNVARILARHGHSVIWAGFAGGHSGAWLRELVGQEGIQMAWVETQAPLRVGFMAQHAKSQHPTTVLPQGFQVSLQECQRLLDKIAGLLPQVRLVIASGSVPDPVANHFYAQLLELCQRNAVPCWLDAYGPAMGLALDSQIPPDLCTPNRDELSSGHNWEKVPELHITDGANPIEVNSHQTGFWQVLPPAIQQVNPIGCGDCYLAGLAHAWLQGWPIEQRLRYAAAAGTANALKLEVAQISPPEIECLINSVIVEKRLS